MIKHNPCGWCGGQGGFEGRRYNDEGIRCDACYGTGFIETDEPDVCERLAEIDARIATYVPSDDDSWECPF